MHYNIQEKLSSSGRQASICLSFALAAVSLQAAAAPYSGNPVALPATLEAENFDKGGPGVGYHDATSTNSGGVYRTSEGVDIIRSVDSAGGGYVVNSFQSGEWLAYTVYAPASGTYKLALRAAANYAWMKPAFNIQVDGQKVTGSVPVPQTGSWSNFQWVEAPPITLSAGQHTIRVVADAQYFNLNQIRIQTDKLAPAPAPGGSYSGTPFSGTPIALPGTFEAENFDKGGEGVAYRDLAAGNAGGQYRTSESVDIVRSSDSAGGYVVNNFQTGEWMTYSVNVPANGRYDLEIRAARTTCGACAAAPAFHMEVDSVNVTGSIPVPDTGSWSTYQWVGKKDVNLTAGTHVLKLVSGGQYFDVDQIRVAASGASSPTPAPAPQVLWRGGMETGNLNEWSEQVNTGAASSFAVTAASAGIPPLSGNWVMQQSVNGSSGGTRMSRYPEIDKLAKAGTPFYVSWWAYYPKKLSFGIYDWYQMWQLASADAAGVGQPIWNIGLNGSNSTLIFTWDPAHKRFSGPRAGESGSRTYTSNVALPVGRWMFFEVMVKPASDHTGAIKLWLNGQVVFDLSQVRTKLPDSSLGGFMYITHNAYGTNLSPMPATHYLDDVTISLGRMPHYAQ